MVYVDRVLCPCKNLEDLATKFSEQVEQCYTEYLQHLQDLVRDNQAEMLKLTRRLAKEPGVVKANAKAKLLRIAQYPEENQKYFAKIFWFLRSRNWISIERSSDFYENLLPGVETKQAFLQVNCDYLLDINEKILAVHYLKQKD